MDCPRCILESKEKTSIYRRGAEQRPERPKLTRETHKAGVKLDRCGDCGGVWLNAGELERIETHAGSVEAPAGYNASVERLKRAYANARRPEPREAEEEPAPLACPGCGEPMFPREWSIGTLVIVDVCIDCRGIWLDAGELEAIEQLFSRR